MKKYILFTGICVLMLSSSCTQKDPIIADWDAYISEHEEWQHTRLERLKSERGWLNLAGLLWLEEGVNTFGSDSSNTIVFPAKFPAFGGKIVLKDSLITLIPDRKAGISVNGDEITEMSLNHDQQENTTSMELGSFRWFIIKRGDKYAIRLRDLEHPRIKELDHIPSYPFNKDWVVEAKYIPFDSVKTIEVPTVIPNFSEFYKAPGKLEFKINRKTHSLLPFKSGDGYFLIVGDATNGIDTYGAGRFLYTKDIKGETVMIDFNKAYNPPCAFSPFATCPLPPLENILDIEIEAGEMAVHLK